jgi:DNA-binding MarR family transcriptional regulator
MTADHPPTTREQARLLHATIQKLKRVVGTLMMDAVSSPAYDFTVAQLNVLMVVQAHQPVTVKFLAEELGVSPASASAMVDRLVDQGALRREQSKIDRRQVEITVTDEARAAMVACEAHVLGFIEGMLERVGPELAHQWCRVYARVSDILDEDIGILRTTGCADDGMGAGSAAVERVRPIEPGQ